MQIDRLPLPEAFRVGNQHVESLPDDRGNYLRVCVLWIVLNRVRRGAIGFVGRRFAGGLSNCSWSVDRRFKLSSNHGAVAKCEGGERWNISKEGLGSRSRHALGGRQRRDACGGRLAILGRLQDQANRG